MNLAGWENAVLIGVGLILILVEIFVLPGFTITGVLGAVALFVGITSILLGAELILQSGVMLAIALGVVVVGAFIFFRLFPRLPFARRLILVTPAKPQLPSFELSTVDKVLPGDIGRAVSPLRPAGIVDLAGERIDAVTEGEYVSAGEAIEVLRIEGGHIVVRRAAEA